jgi:hypothetical protein
MTESAKTTREEREPRKVRVLVLLVLLGTFAVGAVAGAGVSRWLAVRAFPPPPPPPMLPIPVHELDLTPEQHDKLRVIVDRHRPELEAILRETFPKARAINEQIEKEVREILTEPQRKKLDEIKLRRPPPPPPPPPGGFPPGPPPPGFPPPPGGPPGFPPPPPPPPPQF